MSAQTAIAPFNPSPPIIPRSRPATVETLTNVRPAESHFISSAKFFACQQTCRENQALVRGKISGRSGRLDKNLEGSW